MLVVRFQDGRLCSGTCSLVYVRAFGEKSRRCLSLGICAVGVVKPGAFGQGSVKGGACWARGITLRGR